VLLQPVGWRFGGNLTKKKESEKKLDEGRERETFER
jgi:hypothetical protein